MEDATFRVCATSSIVAHVSKILFFKKAAGDVVYLVYIPKENN